MWNKTARSAVGAASTGGVGRYVSAQDTAHSSRATLSSFLLQDELSNTKLNAGALKNLTFNIAGLEQMRINASGNVEMGFGDTW